MANHPVITDADSNRVTIVNIETVCGELRDMFEYFRAMHTTKSHLRYLDYCGNVLDAWGKTGGQ